MARMTDRHGNTVSLISLDGRPTLVVRDRYGYVLHGDRLCIPDPVDVADTARLGVDVGSLA